MNDHNTIIIFKKLKIFNILIAFIFFINFKFLGKMKKYFVFLILIFGKTLGNKNYDSTKLTLFNDPKLLKKIRVNSKITKSLTQKQLKKNAQVFINNQKEVRDRTVSVFNDNLINEGLYLLKIYHLTNDQINSFLYIVFYELIWFAYKVFEISINNTENKDKDELFQILIFNIIIYTFVKNMIIIRIFN